MSSNISLGEGNNVKRKHVIGNNNKKKPPVRLFIHRYPDEKHLFFLLGLLQKFEYHICINKFSVGKCLSHSTRYKVNNKNLSVRLHMEDSFRTQALLLRQLLIEMLGLFFEPA